MTTPSERRYACILFASVAGLPGESGAGLLHEILDSLFRRFRRSIEACGGAVDKFIGETVMGVFGAPVAHGDDVARAVDAAGRLKSDVQVEARERGLALEIRIGLAAGEVHWGPVAGDVPTAIGDVVNVAHRLAEAAPAGGALASAGVESAARGRARFRVAPPLVLRGRAGAVEAFFVEDSPGGASEFPRLAGSAMPLVGREKEMSRLRRTLDEGGFLVGEGEAGVGKSRLVSEMRRETRARGGAWVVLGRANEGTRLPLAPFAAILRGELLAGGKDEADAAVNCALAGLGGPGGVERENEAHLIAMSLGYAVPGARVAALESSRAAAESRRAWELLLRALTAGRRALICIEDLHVADEATFALLEHLATRWRAPGIAIIATTRPLPGPDARPAGFERLRLGDLDPEAAAVVAEIVFRAPLAPELLRLLKEKAGGHPLYAGELARFLRDTGVVGGNPVRLLRPPDALPQSLQGLLVARLDRMSPGVKEALKAASVLGRAFWKGFLGELLGGPVEGVLAEARSHDAVLSQPTSLLPGDEEWLFQHALLRDAAYGLLPKRERARLHARAADLLLARAAAGGRRVRALAAGHRRAAGDAAEAARLWLEAAAEALAAASASEAIEWVREAENAAPTFRSALLETRALRGLARLGPAVDAAKRAGQRATGTEERASALLEEIRSEGNRGGWPRALVLMDEVIALAPSPALHAEALIERGRLLPAMGRAADGFASLDTARTLLDAGAFSGAEETATRAALHEASGRACYYASRLDDALREFGAALSLNRSRGDRRSTAGSVNNLGIVHFMRGEYDLALKAYREALALAIEMGDRYGIDVSQTNIGTVLHSRGEIAAARDAFRTACEIARDIGDQAGLGTTLTNLGTSSWELGDNDAAEAALREAVDLCRRTGSRHGEASALNNLACVLGSAGRHPEGIEFGEASLKLRRDLGDRRGASNTLMALAESRRDSGDFTAAISNAEEAVREWRASGAAAPFDPLVALGKARGAAGDAAGADAAIGEAEQAGAEAQTARGKAMIAMARGDAALGAGKRDEAREWYVRAEREAASPDLRRLREEAAIRVRKAAGGGA